MILIDSPVLISPRTADSRPDPGPLRFTSHSFIPCAIASRPALCAATVAANADDFLDPEKFAFPADAQETTFPARSVIAMIVLLNVALTCAIPEGTVLVFFFLTRAAAFFGGALSCLANVLSYFDLFTFSYWQLFYAYLSAYGHLSAFFVLEQSIRLDVLSHDNSELKQVA